MYRRFNKNIVINTREELYKNTDWEHFYNNREIIEYTYQNAQFVIQGQHNDLESIRNKAFSVFNYLFLLQGGILYMCIAHYKKIQELCLEKSMIFVTTYIILIMIYILLKLVFPSKICIQYGTPSTILQDKKHKPDIYEIKIAQILCLQEAIQKNDTYLKYIRYNLSVHILSDIILMITLAYIMYSYQHYCLFLYTLYHSYF